MKKFKIASTALFASALLTFASCGPNDDKGGMDEKNSEGEGAIDTSRLSNFDTTTTFITVPQFFKKYKKHESKLPG